MTAHEALGHVIDDWKKLILAFHPDAACKWVMDDHVKRPMCGRIALARRTVKARTCVGYMIVGYKAGRDGKAVGCITVNEIKVFMRPKRVSQLPFVIGELFKASLDEVGAILIAEKGTTKIVKHYKTPEDMELELEKCHNALS